MSSKIRSHIESIINAQRSSGDSEQEYRKILARGIMGADDATYAKLSAEAQAWFNSACDASDAKKDLPAFPDEIEDAAPAAGRRRRGGAEPEAAPAAQYTPKAGDKIKVTEADGTVTEGEFIEIDEKADEIVMKDADGELGIPREGAVVESLAPPPAEDTGRRRSSSSAQAEPEAPKDPQVGDTLEVTNKRGKVYVGVLKEDQGDAIVLELLGGEIEDLDKSRIDKVVVKHRAAASGGGTASSTTSTPAADTTPSRRRGFAAADTAGGNTKVTAGGNTKVTAADNGGISVTTRTKELVIENRKSSVEQIAAMLKKEGLVFKDVTMELNYKQTHSLLGMLDARGMLK